LNLYRILVAPVSLLYALMMWIRNKLYDWGILPEQPFDFPLINVGNLSTGGTGKTPHVEYILRLLEGHYKTATLSRGYGRKSMGLIMAQEGITAENLGDEPMQYFMKFKNTVVAVCEKRLYAIPMILGTHQDVEVMVMDDAFQHRSVKAGLNILVTRYDLPFYKDWVLPSGNLREWRSGYKRADIIIVSKCPASLTAGQEKEIIEQIKPVPGQEVFFSTISYGEPVHAFNGIILNDSRSKPALVFSGIADASAFESHSDSIFKSTVHRAFSDHHDFDETDIDDIIHEFKKLGPDAVLVCTEKDRMRLLDADAENALREIPWYYIPIEIKIINNGENFNARLLDFIRKYEEPA
jgi:tetraacyldisaccharide 4'-kinase